MGTALVLGATGGVGGAVTQAMLARGWHVTALVRDPRRAAVTWGTSVAPNWQAGDAMNRADVVRAAEGTSVIVHAVNPPGYRGWDRLVLPMLDNTLAAARDAGARIVLPGTIYNYDPTLASVIDETTPQRPCGRKGAIRVEMERRLAEAAPEVRSVVVRAGDFFGPGADQSWFAQALAKLPLARIVNPGTAGVGHAWAYLPDLAEAILRLLELPPDRLLPYERLQFPGHDDLNGDGMVAAVRRASGRVDLPERRFPWVLMRALAPFGGFPREVLEVRPFWTHPVRLDGQRLAALIGDLPRMELDEAVAASLRGSVAGIVAHWRRAVGAMKGADAEILNALVDDHAALSARHIMMLWPPGPAIPCQRQLSEAKRPFQRLHSEDRLWRIVDLRHALERSD